MSIIKQRKQKMILSWFLGVLTAVAIMGVLVAFSVLDIAKYIQFTLPETKEEIVYVPQLVANKHLKAGTILTEEDITEIMVDATNEVVSITTIDELLGKELLMDVHKMLPMTKPMIERETVVGENQRIFEFDYIKLPFNLETGDFVDVRIVFPNGQDYVVLSKKEVIHYERNADNLHQGLLSLLVDEDEVLRMSSALVDRVLTETAELYLVKYLEPLTQEAALISYPVNRSVLSVLKENPNLVESPDMTKLTNNRYLLDIALKELLDEDDEWFSIFTNESEEEATSTTEETTDLEEKTTTEDTADNDSAIETTNDGSLEADKETTSSAAETLSTSTKSESQTTTSPLTGF